MTAKPQTQNMALFCDFENIALGVRDARYADFDIQKVILPSNNGHIAKRLVVPQTLLG